MDRLALDLASVVLCRVRKSSAWGEMVSESSKLAVGEVINGIYEITGVYGAGGFAVVYRAEQLNLGRRRVAIKVLNPVPDGERGEVITQRFLHEAQAAASIHHPNVVMIHDIGEPIPLSGRWCRVTS